MASREIERINPTGVRLRRSFEQQALRQMMEQLDKPEKVEAVCRLMHAYCELIRQDAAVAKSRTAAESSPISNAARRAAPKAPRIDDTAVLAQTVQDLYGVTLPPERPDDPGRASSRRHSPIEPPADASADQDVAATSARSRSLPTEN